MKRVLKSVKNKVIVLPEKFGISRTDLKITGLILTIKTLIFAFGLQSFLLFSNGKLPGIYWIFGIWNRWDAQSYLSIARHGYTSVGERSFQIVFFPFYPFLVSLLSIITRDVFVSALLISGIASIALGLLFYRLVKLDHSENIGMSSVWFLFIFPTGYFLHIPYTESLFLALVIGCFYFVRKQKWLLAGLLGFFACATRINGLILCLALPFEIWLIWRETKRFDVRWSWLGLIPFGFVSYLMINYFVMGNAFSFLDAQREHWQKFLQPPWTSIYRKSKEVFDNPLSKIDGFFELFFAAIGLIAIILGWKYLRPSYRVWMIASWLLFVSTAWLLSVPRYVLTMFPLFILIALMSKNKWVGQLISFCSILYLALFIIQFVQGRWAF